MHCGETGKTPRQDQCWLCHDFVNQCVSIFQFGHLLHQTGNISRECEKNFFCQFVFLNFGISITLLWRDTPKPTAGARIDSEHRSVDREDKVADPVSRRAGSVVTTLPASQQRWSRLIVAKRKYFCCCWRALAPNITWKGTAVKPAPQIIKTLFHHRLTWSGSCQRKSPFNSGSH